MAEQVSDTPKITPEEYGEFLRRIELKQVYLSDARVKRVRTPEPDSTLSFGQSIGKSKFRNTGHGFAATFNFHVILLEEDEEKPFGDINVTYTAEYSSENKMSRNIFEVFEAYNLPLNLYPYVREYVHTTTNRMGMPTLILPTFKSG